MRVLLVRHGETEENVREILQGHRYGTLTERGQRQIALLAERLTTEPIEKIFSSDLARARYTTERINAGRALPVIESPLLRERCLGEFEGRAASDYLAHVKALGVPPLSYAPQGGESILDVAARARAAWKMVLTEAPPCRCILISSHGLFNRALLAYLQGYPDTRILGLEQENACVNVITCDRPDHHAVELINCVRHLPEEAFAVRGKTSF